jgi:hypothetical protein
VRQLACVLRVARHSQAKRVNAPRRTTVQLLERANVAPNGPGDQRPGVALGTV